MKQISHRVDSLICEPKKEQSSSITFKSHNGSWSQQIKPGKQILEKQIRPNFSHSKSLLYKILPPNVECVNQPFILVIHHIWGETGLWGAVFIIPDLWQNAVFHNFANKLHSFNIQDYGSTRGLSAKPLKIFPKSPIRPAGSHFWQAPNSRF